MSATRDKSQKVAFVYTNLHQLMVKGAERSTPASEGSASSANANANSNSNSNANERVLRPFGAVPNESLRGVVSGQVVRAYRPKELSRSQVEKVLPQPLHPQLQKAHAHGMRTASLSQREALESLRGNLKSLMDLHSRLRFMLKELEQLIRD